MAEADNISEAAHKCRQLLDWSRPQALEPGQQHREQQPDVSIEAMKPTVRSSPQGETSWSEMPPDGTGGNFVAASASEGPGDALGSCCREHPTMGRSLLPPWAQPKRAGAPDCSMPVLSVMGKAQRSLIFMGLNFSSHFLGPGRHLLLS